LKSPLTPHLQEINIHKSFLSSVNEWITMYKQLCQEEGTLISLIETTENPEVKSYYRKKLRVLSKRLNSLGKRLNFEKLLQTYDKITKRLTELYEFDKKLLADPLHPRKQWSDQGETNG